MNQEGKTETIAETSRSRIMRLGMARGIEDDGGVRGAKGSQQDGV